MEHTTAIVPLNDTLELGKVLAASGFFDDSRQAAQAVVKVLAGREIGIGPIASMTGIHIIKGRPAIGAGIIASAIKRSGRYTYRIRQHDATVCEIEFFERNGSDKWESIGVSAFTIDDARKAGTQNLERFARNMLFARCISNGARWYTPDIFGGPVYTPEELGTPVDGEGDVIEGSVIRRVAAPADDFMKARHDSITDVIRRVAAPADDSQVYEHADAAWEQVASAPSPLAKAATRAASDRPKVAQIKTKRFFDLAIAFAERFPDWRHKNGEPDNGHICASAAKLGITEITNENVDEVFTQLEVHAQTKE